MIKQVSTLFAITIHCFVLAQSQSDQSNLVTEKIPSIPPSLVERMNQFQSTRSASLSGWSPDGSHMIMSTRFGDVSQLHKLDHPGGARRQITFSKEPIGRGSYCPDTSFKGMVYTRDNGGNEFSQLYWHDILSGKAQMISDGGRSQNSMPLWSNAGNRFVTVSTRRNGKDYDLYTGDMTKPADQKLILQKGGSWSPIDWSPDDSRLVVRNYISANKSFLFVLNLASLELTPVNPSHEEISYGGADWSADGKNLFIVSDEKTEFKTLRYYNIATGKSTDLTSSIPWDVESAVMDRERKNLVFSANENGVTKLYRLNTSTLKYEVIPDLPSGVISGLVFRPGKNELGMTINTSQSPGDIYSANLNNNIVTRWTYSETGGLPKDLFVVPTLIHYETFDQVNKNKRKIPAFYYRPKNVDAKTPVVIMIHGGPEAQFRPNFNAFISFLVNELGVSVIAPNVRGSSGYGKNYLKLDNGYLREESVKDIGALIDWIAKEPGLDASRIAVYGGSYGGYMVLASMVHYNEKIKCGVDIVGISNFVTFLKNTEDYRKDLRRVEYGDERDPKMNAFQQKISPLNNAEKITRPLFIIQGLNDPRVPASEAEQMKEKVKSRGGDVWYLLAKDEGHGFSKKKNLDYMQWAVVLFLEEKLIK
jgi:dipeptidyl aminopeptidase/acylaminoacyl peptidase